MVKKHQFRLNKLTFEQFTAISKAIEDYDRQKVEKDSILTVGVIQVNVINYGMFNFAWDTPPSLLSSSLYLKGTFCIMGLVTQSLHFS